MESLNSAAAFVLGLMLFVIVLGIVLLLGIVHIGLAVLFLPPIAALAVLTLCWEAGYFELGLLSAIVALCCWPKWNSTVFGWLERGRTRSGPKWHADKKRLYDPEGNITGYEDKE